MIYNLAPRPRTRVSQEPFNLPPPSPHPNPAPPHPKLIPLPSVINSASFRDLQLSDTGILSSHGEIFSRGFEPCLAGRAGPATHLKGKGKWTAWPSIVCRVTSASNILVSQPGEHENKLHHVQLSSCCGRALCSRNCVVLGPLDLRESQLKESTQMRLREWRMHTSPSAPLAKICCAVSCGVGLPQTLQPRHLAHGSTALPWHSYKAKMPLSSQPRKCGINMHQQPQTKHLALTPSTGKLCQNLRVRLLLDMPSAEAERYSEDQCAPEPEACAPGSFHQA